MFSYSNNIELLCVIIKAGLGSKVMKKAKENGISGGTILLGKGTVNNKLLDFMGLADVSKEVIIMLSSKEVVREALKSLDEEFKFYKPNHGIAFTLDVGNIFGCKKLESIKDKKGGEKDMYNLITVIVDKGRAEDAIDAATKAGSKGGTILNARGSGIHETSKVFAMEIEPEKEVVLILSEEEKTEAIVNSIREDLKIDEPGKGIIFVQEINKTYGLYKK